MASYIEDLVQNIYTKCDMSGLDALNQGLKDAIWYSGELEKNLRDAQRAQKKGFDFHSQAINKSKEAYQIESLRQKLEYQQATYRAALAEKQEVYDDRREKRQKRYLQDLRSQSRLLRYTTRLITAYFGINTLKNIINMGSALQLTQKSIEGLTGSKQDWAFITLKAREFGINLDTVAKGYKNFYSAASMAGVEKGNIQKMYGDLLLAARSIGASEQQIGGALLALEQIYSKGRLSMEELRRQLGNALPGAFEIGAKAMGVTTAKFNEMIKAGISAQEFVPKFIETYKEQFKNGWKDVEQTVNVAQGRLRVAWQEFTIAFVSGDAGKGFVMGLNALTKLISSPAFSKFTIILGKIFSLVAKILSLAVEQLPLIIMYLGYAGLTKVITGLITQVMALQLAFFEATGTAITFGQAGTMAIASMAGATVAFTARLAALLGLLFIIQDVLYFIGERFWGWNTKSALGARVAQHNRMKNIQETDVIKDSPLNYYKKGSRGYIKLQRAMETGDTKTISEMMHINQIPALNSKGETIWLEKNHDVKNDIKIDIKIDGGKQDPRDIGNFVYTKILNELTGNGIQLNPEKTLTGNSY